MNNRKHEDFGASEFGKRILAEMRQENEKADPGFPDFIGCGSNSCFLDRPAPGKSNGKGVCECFGGLLPVKRMKIMKYIRREQAKLRAAADEIDALRAEVERLKTKAEIGGFVMEAVRQSARNKSTITAIVRLKDSPCKP